MIIKGLLRRYERWNPVHPTLGTFWGMGIGIGCGIGWGPGFGPEAIGFVGAGCGAGFSVGITLVGAGIGLPSNHLFQAPYKALTTRAGAMESVKVMAEDSWNLIAPCLLVLGKETHLRFSALKTSIPSTAFVALSQLKKNLSKHMSSSLQHFETFKEPRPRPPEDDT